MRRATGQREVRPVWNNAQRQSSPRATISNSTARYVNTTASRPTVNGAKPSSNVFHKSHSPLRRPFNQKSAVKTNNFNEKVYTAKFNNVTTAGTRKYSLVLYREKRENVVKSSACWIWRPTGKVIDHISKDSGSYMPKRFNYVDPQGRLKHNDWNILPNMIIKTLMRLLHLPGKVLKDVKNYWNSGPEWLFDIDSLTKSMNYKPVTVGNQTNGDAGIETNVNTGQVGQEKASDHEYILLPLMLSNSSLSIKVTQRHRYKDLMSTNIDSTASPSVSTAGPSINTASENKEYK
ncbi:hypothetical protein Tco_0158304 [Tanacetum coccineum]